MGFSLYNLFKAGLLVANAVTILNPKRFLKTCKSFLRPPQAPDEYLTAHLLPSVLPDNLTPADISEHNNPMKNQVIGLLQATAYLKLPLIACNVLVIVVEVLFG